MDDLWREYDCFTNVEYLKKKPGYFLQFCLQKVLWQKHNFKNNLKIKQRFTDLPTLVFFGMLQETNSCSLLLMKRFDWKDHQMTHYALCKDGEQIVSWPSLNRLPYIWTALLLAMINSLKTERTNYSLTWHEVFNA